MSATKSPDGWTLTQDMAHFIKPAERRVGPNSRKDIEHHLEGRHAPANRGEIDGTEGARGVVDGSQIIVLQPSIVLFGDVREHDIVGVGPEEVSQVDGLGVRRGIREARVQGFDVLVHFWGKFGEGLPRENRAHGRCPL